MCNRFLVNGARARAKGPAVSFVCVCGGFCGGFGVYLFVCVMEFCLHCFDDRAPRVSRSYSYICGLSSTRRSLCIVYIYVHVIVFIYDVYMFIVCICLWI